MSGGTIFGPLPFREYLQLHHLVWSHPRQRPPKPVTCVSHDELKVCRQRHRENPFWSFASYWPLWLEHIAVEPGWFPGDGLWRIRNWMVLVSPLYEGSKDNLSRPMAKWIQVLFIFIRLNLLLLSRLYPTACWHALYLASFEVHVHYFLFLFLLIVWK